VFVRESAFSECVFECVCVCVHVSECVCERESVCVCGVL